MKCSCRKGKSISSIERGEVKELLEFLRGKKKVLVVVLELLNSFRPTEGIEVRWKRIFLAVRKLLFEGEISVFECEKLLSILERFLLSGSDKKRGDFLEVLVSRLGPFYFKERYRRLNQCKVFKGSREISPKEIDVAFVSKNFAELHECKANMVRQWRDPLTQKSRRGSKLFFLNSLAKECGEERKVIPCVFGLEGKLGVKYVKKVLELYGFTGVNVLGRREVAEKAGKL